ncbi:putative E3 ubiquitin ligase [Handroanthus impetiginosus]|uniref:RBR-type E3 ubiquitin transferase n=1 Tax=Handroanthus impetiginosus TaxID=429701 RepID=A0A2G9HIA3_9LAMI|nr:putative E3 ubiquitin ligase [Handroanthus impetiginosus]
MDSDDDFYYSSDDDEVEQSADDGGEVDPDFIAVSAPKKHYKILKEEDIKRLQENDIAAVSDVLSVSKGSATALLCRYNWNLSSVYDNWFSDEPAGSSSPKRKSQKQICKICFEDKNKTMLSSSCGHLFCSDCFRTYISTSINDGPGCLTLLCPEPDCKAFIDSDMVDSLTFRDDKVKYYRYLNRSYVESTKNRKWCPAPGCEFAVEIDLTCENYDVMCDCSYKFCWNCMEESHRPVDCTTVAKWIEKNSSEAENTSYILAYTKPCPKCRKAIEKNQGCNHMTCRQPCRFEFCWVCLGPWKEHGSYYDCNKYKEKEEVSELEKNRENARKYLERYTHYYERWDANDKAMKRAVTDLSRARNEHVDKLAKVQEDVPAQMEFVIDAWDQIVECRRVLKWTYAYGYYVEQGKMDFFVYLQGEAEFALERLHHCAEKEMGEYLSAECPSKDFKDFRTKLVDLTTVTRNYFENLVRALENNLSEVENVGTS